MTNGDEILEDAIKDKLFLDGPGEAVVNSTVDEFKKIAQFQQLFSDSIANYERDDFGISSLPAIRFFNESYRKETESHYITGELKCDIILPPSLRREEVQNVQDVLSAAMIQQFRSPMFFEALKIVIPGLNELGKTFDVDKSKAMVWNDDLCPMIRMTINFRIDQKIWDAYLEREGRTKDRPFEVTLGNLKKILGRIDGVPAEDASVVDVTLGTSQKIGG